MPSSLEIEKVVAVILAAGFSRRFGERDKRAEPFMKGTTLLAATLNRAAECFAHSRVVVREDDDLAALGLPADTPVIRTQNASLGQAASMADGFTAIDADETLTGCRAAAVMLGDVPFIQAGTIAFLCARADSNQIVRATYEGRPGHPVLFGRDFWPELKTLSGDRGGAELIARHPFRYREIPVTDPGVCRDVDTLADLRRQSLDRR